MADNDNSNKKPSFWKRFIEWWRLTLLSYATEVQDRILMSWKRIIKFLGIAVIPILYGVICTLAFWNPIDSLGRAPVAIMDEDYTVLSVSNVQKNGTETNGGYTYNIGAVKDFGNGNPLQNLYWLSNTGLTKDDIFISQGGAIAIKNTSLKNTQMRNRVQAQIFDNIVKNGDTTSTTFDLTNGQDVGYNANNSNPTFSFKLATTWDILKDSFWPKTDDNKADTDYNFSAPKMTIGDDSVTLEHITYINDQKKIDDNWQRTKYWIQAKIPEGFTENLLTYAGLMLNNPDGVNTDKIKALVSTISDNQFNIWSTHERNFIFGYLMNTIKGVLPGIIMQQMPGLADTIGANKLSDVISVNGADVKSLLGVNTNEIIPSIRDTQNYIIVKSSGMPVAEGSKKARLNDASLFGDVDNGTTVANVGGKFINTILTAFEVVDLDQIQLLPSDFRDALTDIINKIKSILIDNGKNEKAVVKKEQTKAMFDTVSSDSVLDSALVELNKDVYNWQTGKPFDSKLFKAIWDGLKELPSLKNILPNDIDSFKANALFKPDEKIITTDLYKERFDNDVIKANPDYFFGATDLDEIFSKAIGSIALDKLNGFSPTTAVNVKVQGSEHSIYGFGLGIFFLTLGLFVGAFTQTFIFDRAKRLAKAKWSNWYVSKTLLMWTVGFFQVTAELWIIYAFGWSQIGAGNMCLVWLWLLFCDAVFIVIVQGLWFSLKDEVIGKFLVIIVMVCSIGAGGGEFPALSQLGFFRGIQYIVPFTYAFKGLDEIVFGISGNGTAGWSTDFVFQQLGILLIYVVLFFCLGFFVGGPNRMKEMNYGSHYGFAVAGAMRALGIDTSKFQLVRKTTKKGKKIFKYDWKSLGDEFKPDLYFQCRKMYKFDGEFKWWTRKHHDFVQKPNYSDEEIVERNE